MRDYGRIKTTIWRSKKLRSLGADDDARLAYFYLHTCQHVNSVGCFVLPDAYAVADLGWVLIRYRNAINILSKANLIGFDSDAEVVRIVDYLKHDPFANPKHAIGAVKIALMLPDCLEKFLLFQDIAASRHIDKIASIGAELQRLSVGFPKGIDTVSEPFRYPEPLPYPLPYPLPSSLPPPDEQGALPVDAAKDEDEGKDFEITFSERLRVAVGLPAGGGSRYWRGVGLDAHISAWRGLGLTDAQILQVAADSRARHPEPPNGPKALDGWMQTAARGLAGAMRVQGIAAAGDLSPDDKRLALMAAYARLINGDGYCPQAQVSPSMAREMIARGMVTADRCKLRGIAA